MLTEILIQTSLIIIIFIINYYLTSYFKQKGKNLADKEDIGEIREIIESVKADFNSQTKKLEFKLNVISSLKISFESETRLAIINFIETYNNLFNLCQIPAYIVNAESIDEVTNYIKLLNDKYSDLSSKEALFDLYVEDEDLLDLKKGLVSKLKFGLFPESLLLLVTLPGHKKMLELTTIDPNDPPEIQERKKNDRKGMRDIKDLYDEYIQKQINFGSDILAKQSNFYKKTREHLVVILDTTID